MVRASEEYFGSDAQKDVLRRARAVFDNLSDDEPMSCHGRVVGHISPQYGPVAEVVQLTRLQGASHYASVSAQEIDEVLAQASEAGISTVNYARWEIHTDQIAATGQKTGNAALPDGLSIERLTPDTPEATIQSFVQTSLVCGVLPAWRSAHTGQALQARTLVAVTPNGQVVSSAYAARYINGTSALANSECFWGMLTTHPDWRGKGLSVLLGRMLLDQMSKDFGFTHFYTGITPGNVPSEAVCSKIGLVHSGNHLVTMADPARVPGGRITK